jgi:hypothetical protein
MRRTVARVSVIGVLLTTVTPLVTPAEATTPGHNGVLAYIRLHPDLCPDLRTVQVAGTSARTLVQCPQYIGEPAFSPSGKRIAVSYIRSSGAAKLALVPATGGTPQVVSTNVSPARSPSFDRTGQILAFTGGDAGGTDQRALYTVPVTGGTATQLTPASPPHVNDEPDYSPAADVIAWTRRTTASYDVWTVSVDGQGHNPSSLTNLTNGVGNSRYPSWSPDGTHLAFASDRSGTWQIYVMTATGADVTQVTTGTRPHIQPVWSPNGKLIAFTTGCTTSGCVTLGPDDHMVNGNLQVVDVSNLASPGAPTTVIGRSAAEFDPQWARACTSRACPAAASISRTATLARFGHTLRAHGALSSPRPSCVSRVTVRLQYENVINRGFHTRKHWVTLAKTSTSRAGKYHLALPRLMTGWYRVIAPAKRIGENECVLAVTHIRQNLTVRDKRGDSRGPVDLFIAWATVKHGVVTMSIRTVDPFSNNPVGKPCLPMFVFLRNGDARGGSIGCVSNSVLDIKGVHKPLTTRRPDARTIQYRFKMSELGTKFAFMEWVPWSRGTSDADWWDVFPNDSDIGTYRPPGNPLDMPYLFKRKPAYQR